MQEVAQLSQFDEELYKVSSLRQCGRMTPKGMKFNFKDTAMLSSRTSCDGETFYIVAVEHLKCS